MLMASTLVGATFMGSWSPWVPRPVQRLSALSIVCPCCLQNPSLSEAALPLSPLAHFDLIPGISSCVAWGYSVGQFLPSRTGAHPESDTSREPRVSLSRPFGENLKGEAEGESVEFKGQLALGKKETSSLCSPFVAWGSSLVISHTAHRSLHATTVLSMSYLPDQMGNFWKGVVFFCTLLLHNSEPHGGTLHEGDSWSHKTELFKATWG